MCVYDSVIDCLGEYEIVVLANCGMMRSMYETHGMNASMNI